MSGNAVSRFDDLIGPGAVTMLIEGFVTSGVSGGVVRAASGIVPGNRLTTIVMRRGRTDAESTTTAGTFQASITGGELLTGSSPLAVGRGIRIRVDRTKLTAALGGVALNVQNDPGKRFTGQITNLGPIEIRPNAGAVEIPCSGSSLLARALGSEYAVIPASPTSDRDLVVKGFTQARDNLIALNAFEWVTAGAPYVALANARPAVSLVSSDWFLPISYKPLSGAFSELLLSTLGTVLIDRRDGRVDFVSRASRLTNSTPGDGLANNLLLPADSIGSPLTVSQALADVVNKPTVGYGTANPQATSYDFDLYSSWKYGLAPVTFGTNAPNATEATKIAQRWTWAYADPRYLVESATVDVLALIERGRPADLAFARAALTLEIGKRVALPALPAGFPAIDAYAYVEAVEETITRNSWVLKFSLVPERHLIPKP